MFILKFNKRVMVLFLALFMTLSLSNYVFASNVNSNINDIGLELKIDIDSLNLDIPYTSIQEYVRDDGVIIINELIYTPNNSRTTPSVGTWRTTCTWKFLGLTTMEMSYDFDLSKSGSEWTMSNGRNLHYFGSFVSFSNSDLSITRATSTPIYPAEINGAVDTTIFDNAWVTIAQGRSIVTTKILDNYMSVFTK